MEFVSTGNNDGFDDNGVQCALVLANWKEIDPSESICQNDADDSQLSHYDLDPTGRDEDESTASATGDSKAEPIDDDRGTTSFEVIPEAVNVTNDENGQLIPNDQKASKRRKGKGQKKTKELPICHIVKKEGPDIVDGRSAIRTGKVEASEAKFQSGRSAKDGGYFKSNSDLDTLSSLVEKEGPEIVDGRSAIREGKAQASEAKFQSGLSANDGGYLKSNSDLDKLSSLAYIWCIICVKISCQLSVSITIGMLLLAPTVGVEGALTSVPINTLVVVGNTARINCSTDLSQSVFWARTLARADVHVEQWLYYGNDGFDSNKADERFSIDIDEAAGRYDLIIADVQHKDAGRFVCIDEYGLGARAPAELVVSDPIKCDSQIPREGVMGNNVFGIVQDFIQISCNLTYTGNQSPTLQWSGAGSDIQDDEREVSVAKQSFITSTLKLPPSKKFNEVKFQCKATTEGTTQHTVDSGLQWESETVIVKYAEFATEEVNACPGIEWNLVCSPPCSYSFEEKKDRGCRCMYTFYDKRTNYEVSSYAVKCAEENNSLPVVYISVVTVTVVALLATVTTLLCVRQLKKTKGRPGQTL